MALNVGIGVGIDFGLGIGVLDGNEIYNQHFVTVNLNGRWLQGFMDGTPITITPIAGQVSTTEGTDGPGHNIATKQGCTITIDLRESSPDHSYIARINKQQYDGGGYVPMTLVTGTGRYFTCDVLVSQPGALTTGGPEQGSHTYTFVTKKTDLY